MVNKQDIFAVIGQFFAGITGFRHRSKNSLPKIHLQHPHSDYEEYENAACHENGKWYFSDDCYLWQPVSGFFPAKNTVNFRSS